MQLMLVSLKAIRKKVSTLKLLPLLAKSGDFNYILHTINVLPLVPKEDVVSTYEVWFFDQLKFALIIRTLGGFTPTRRTPFSLAFNPPPQTSP
jgi:hypothetical protein